MIKFISMWTQGIIVSVIIATIIEMLLPDNGNGKYIKVVVGLFILFSIVSPLISKFGGDKTIKNLDLYTENYTSSAIETSSRGIDNNSAIRKMYEENLKIDIKSKISQKGYIVGDISLDILNNNEYTLNRINVKIIGKNEEMDSNGKFQETTTIVENIENIKIDLGGSGKDEEQNEQSCIGESEKRKLKEYLSSVYEVNENNIYIN